MNEATEVIVADGRLEGVIEVVKTLARIVKLNSDSIQEVGLFSQSIAQYVIGLHELISNNLTTLSGVVVQFSERFDLLELMQDAQLELIEAVTNLSYFSLGLGVLNTALIFVIGIYLILRKK